MLRSRQEIKTFIENFVSEDLHLTSFVLTEQIIDQLDSMQKLSLAVALEDHFKVALPLDTGDISDLEQLIAMIQGAPHAAS